MLARVYICVRDGGESEVNKMRILLSPEFYIKSTRMIKVAAVELVHNYRILNRFKLIPPLTK